MSEHDEDDTTGVIDAERGMWSPTTRYDDAWMERHLHPDFVEFGRSGRVYDRTTVMEGERVPFDADLDGLAVTLLSPDIALVTYRSTLRLGGDPATAQPANRSSVWLRVGGSWRLRFHQGTPTP